MGEIDCTSEQIQYSDDAIHDHGVCPIRVVALARVRHLLDLRFLPPGDPDVRLRAGAVLEMRPQQQAASRRQDSNILERTWVRERWDGELRLQARRVRSRHGSRVARRGLGRRERLRPRREGSEGFRKKPFHGGRTTLSWNTTIVLDAVRDGKVKLRRGEVVEEVVQKQGGYAWRLIHEAQVYAT